MKLFRIILSSPWRISKVRISTRQLYERELTSIPIISHYIQWISSNSPILYTFKYSHRFLRFLFYNIRKNLKHPGFIINLLPPTNFLYVFIYLIKNISFSFHSFKFWVELWIIWLYNEFFFFNYNFFFFENYFLTKMYIIVTYTSIPMPL